MKKERGGEGEMGLWSLICPLGWSECEEDKKRSAGYGNKDEGFYLSDRQTEREGTAGEV